MTISEQHRQTSICRENYSYLGIKQTDSLFLTLLEDVEEGSLALTILLVKSDQPFHNFKASKSDISSSKLWKGQSEECVYLAKVKMHKLILPKRPRTFVWSKLSKLEELELLPIGSIYHRISVRAIYHCQTGYCPLETPERSWLRNKCSGVSYFCWNCEKTISILMTVPKRANPRFYYWKNGNFSENIENIWKFWKNFILVLLAALLPVPEDIYTYIVYRVCYC